MVNSSLSSAHAFSLLTTFQILENHLEIPTLEKSLQPPHRNVPLKLYAAARNLSTADKLSSARMYAEKQCRDVSSVHIVASCWTFEPNCRYCNLFAKKFANCNRVFMFLHFHLFTRALRIWWWYPLIYNVHNECNKSAVNRARLSVALLSCVYKMFMCIMYIVFYLNVYVCN